MIKTPKGVGGMFAGRRTQTGRTWGCAADDRDWMTVEEMWDRHPERFTGRGVSPDDADPASAPWRAAS